MRRTCISIIFTIVFLMSSMVLINENEAVAETMTEQEMFIGIDYEFPTYSLNKTMNITMDTTIPFNISSSYDFYYEPSTTGEIGLVGEWMVATMILNNSGNVSIKTEIIFKNGEDNFVRYKVVNETDHGFISDPYNVWVDARGPVYYLLSHSEDEYQLNPRQEIRIRCEDVESGVNASTVQYRYSTSGEDNLTEWLVAPEIEDEHYFQIIIDLLLSRGDQNFIQVRAGDLAGNNITTSRIYNIKVNTIPTPVLVSPVPGGFYQEEIKIIFDSSESYDHDGDRLVHTWYFSTGEEKEILGEVGTVMVILKPGLYNISLEVTDRVGYSAWLNFSITVNETIEPEPEEIDPDLDTDSDGMPDVYEIEYGFEIFVKDGLEDPDYDGFTNIQEYENGTNPLDINSHPTEISSSSENDEDTTPIFLTWGMCLLFLGIMCVALFTIVAIILVLVLKLKDPKG